MFEFEMTGSTLVYFLWFLPIQIWKCSQKRDPLIDGLSCLTLLSTIFQLYHGGQFYCWRKLEYLEKTINLSQVTDELYHIMLYRAHLTMKRVKTHNFVVMDTDCTGYCKSNYHTIMSTMAPTLIEYTLDDPLQTFLFLCVNLKSKFANSTTQYIV